MQEEMQASRKEARDLENSLSQTLNEYLRTDILALQKGTLEKRNANKRLEGEVTALLDKLNVQIDRMENMGSSAGVSVAWKAQISRLRDLYHTSQSDFRKTRELIKSRLESHDLLSAAKADLEEGGMDTEEERLYRLEQQGIHSASSRIDESIGRALAVQEALRSQRDRMKRATLGLANMAESIPGVNQLVRAAGRKKTKDNMIVALVIALFLCGTIWWMSSA